MSRLTRDGTAEPVSRDQILRHVRGQGNIHFPCSADHEQDWQPYPVDPYSAICNDHTYILTTQPGPVGKSTLTILVRVELLVQVNACLAREGLDAFRFFFKRSAVHDTNAPDN